LLEAIRAMAGDKLGAMLDLGCGTGLAGVAFRPYVDRLVGMDISPGMIEQAKAKNVYDELAAADLLEFLHAESESKFDLVLAADVFVYCSDLAPIAAASARVMKHGALFAFTVETHGGSGALLQGTLRYAHAEDHVRAAIAAAHRKRVRDLLVDTKCRAIKVFKIYFIDSSWTA
jgi:predicted TPR repeat methyltransferase